MPYSDTVRKLLEEKEGEHIQFKEARNRFSFEEAARCCCALANNCGGRLVFGISDKRPRTVVKSQAFEQPERTRTRLTASLKVDVDFHLFTYYGKRILVFDVKSRPIGLPVQYEGIAWIYEGDVLKPMPEAVRYRIYEENGDDFSSRTARGQSWKTLTKRPSKIFAGDGLKRAVICSSLLFLKSRFSVTAVQLRMKV